MKKTAQPAGALATNLTPLPIAKDRQPISYHNLRAIGDKRRPNAVVRGLNLLFRWLADFGPMFSALFGFLGRSALVVVNLVILTGTIVISFAHSLELLQYAGLRNGLEWVGVVVWELAFIFSSVVLSQDFKRGNWRSGWAPWTGFIMGLSFVIVSNYLGMADNTAGKIIGVCTPLLLLVFKGILAHQFKRKKETADQVTTQEEITQVGDEGIAQEEITQVGDKGIAQEEITQVGDEGIAQEEITQVGDKGIAQKETAQVGDKGIAQKETAQVGDKGITQEDIAQVGDKGIAQKETAQVGDKGITQEEITQVGDEGIAQKETAQVGDKGIAQEEITQVGDKGITQEEIAQVGDKGITQEDIAQVGDKGITQEDIAQVGDKGITQEDIAQVGDKGIAQKKTAQAGEIAQQESPTQVGEITQQVGDTQTEEIDGITHDEASQGKVVFLKNKKIADKLKKYRKKEAIAQAIKEAVAYEQEHDKLPTKRDLMDLAGCTDHVARQALKIIEEVTESQTG